MPALTILQAQIDPIRTPGHWAPLIPALHPLNSPARPPAQRLHHHFSSQPSPTTHQNTSISASQPKHHACENPGVRQPTRLGQQRQQQQRIGNAKRTVSHRRKQNRTDVKSRIDFATQTHRRFAAVAGLIHRGGCPLLLLWAASAVIDSAPMILGARQFDSLHYECKGSKRSAVVAWTMLALESRERHRLPGSSVAS